VNVGTVTVVFHHRKFGFLVDERGVKRFFCAKKMRDPQQFALVREGSRVAFAPAERSQGPWAADAWLVDE
jgi:cold shock CspA family protein